MAVVTLKWSTYEEGPETAVQVYNVTDVSSGADAITAVASSSYGMTVNASYPGRPLLKAEQPVAKTPEGPLYYEVWFRFSIPNGGGDHSTPGTDPLNEPAEVDWHPVITSEPVDRDTDGNVIMQPSGESLDPPATRDWTNWEIIITRNESFFDFFKYEKFQNTVNLNAITTRQPNNQIVTFPPGTLKCKYIAPAEKFKVTASYVKMAFNFEYRRFLPWVPAGAQSAATSPHNIWIRAEATSGYYAASGATYAGQIVFRNGKEPSKPIPVTSSGLPLDTSSYVIRGEGGATATAVSKAAPAGVTAVLGPLANGVRPYFLVWKNYIPVDFSELNL